MKIIQTLLESEFKNIYIVDVQGKKQVCKQYFQHENKAIFMKLKLSKCSYFPIIYQINDLENGFEIFEEFIDGVTLRTLLPIDELKTIIDFALQICDAMDFLYRRKIVHRDLKPENIMIMKNQKLKIIDFDISKYTKDHKNKDTQMFGSLGYAAPEQFGFSQSDFRSDIYAFGNVLNEMSINCLVQEGVTSNALRQIILKCTKIDPSQRYENVEKLQNDLLRVQLHKSRYTLPGFRMNKASHKVIAVFGYAFIILLSSVIRSGGPNSSIYDHMFAKLMTFLLCSITVIVTTNYMDIDQLNPFKRYHFIGRLILWITLVFMTLFVLIVISTIVG